jgi:transcriptional/translational regulatory protein YebC/TACO1
LLYEDFIFTRKGVFKIDRSALGGKEVEDFEFELIDYGMEDFAFDEDDVYIYTDYTDFNQMQKALEELKIDVKNAELQYLPNTYVDLTEEQAQEVLDMVERLEGDDDVQNVYHNLK